MDFFFFGMVSSWFSRQGKYILISKRVLRAWWLWNVNFGEKAVSCDSDHQLCSHCSWSFWRPWLVPTSVWADNPSRRSSEEMCLLQARQCFRGKSRESRRQKDIPAQKRERERWRLAGSRAQCFLPDFPVRCLSGTDGRRELRILWQWSHETPTSEEKKSFS